MALTDEQLKRLAYGAAHNVLQEVLETGELPEFDFGEYLPTGIQQADVDYSVLQQAIEGVVMSDLFESAARLDK
jgi:hypothetical protein